MSESGEPLPLRGGARLSGRAGSWGLGFLSIHQDRTGDVPANTFSVARIRRDLFAHSDAGVIFVSRESARPGDFNRSYGADLNVRAGSELDQPTGSGQATTGPDLRGGNDQKKISSKWDDGFLHLQMIFADIGRNFRPEVGFVPRNDVRSYQWNGGVRPRPAGGGLVREWHPHTNIKLFTDRENLHGHERPALRPRSGVSGWWAPRSQSQPAVRTARGAVRTAAFRPHPGWRLRLQRIPARV